MASPIDGQKFSLDSTSLGTSIDSAMVTATNTFAKNRFLSGDHVNANNRDALLLRRQLFAIGKFSFFMTLLEIIVLDWDQDECCTVKPRFKGLDLSISILFPSKWELIKKDFTVLGSR